MSIRCLLGFHSWEQISDKEEVDYAVYSNWTSPYPSKSDWFEYDGKCERCGKESKLVDEVFTENHPAVKNPTSVGYIGKTNTVQKPKK